MKSLLQFILVLLTICAAISEEPRVKIAVKKRIDNCKRRSKKGDILFVEYKGYLEDGTVFDTNVGEMVPFRLVLGSSQAIKGFDDGLYRMCEGEKRRLIIPPELGYGSEGHELIPPNSVLYFEIELFKLTNRLEL